MTVPSWYRPPHRPPRAGRHAPGRDARLPPVSLCLLGAVRGAVSSRGPAWAG